MFERAIELDPHYARAMAECSLTYIVDIFTGWTDARDEWLARAEKHAKDAMRIDPTEPWALVALALIHQLHGRNAEALPLLERAHALNPNDYEVKQALAHALTYAGSAERAVQLMEQAQRLDPHKLKAPRSLVLAYFFAGRYEDALRAIDSSAHFPGSPKGWHLYKAAIHAELGQLEEARAAIAEALKLDPDLTLEGEHERRLAMGLAPANAEFLAAALRKAGLPSRRPIQSSSR